MNPPKRQKIDRSKSPPPYQADVTDDVTDDMPNQIPLSMNDTPVDEKTMLSDKDAHKHFENAMQNTQ